MGKVTIIIESKLNTRDLERCCHNLFWLTFMEQKVEALCGSTPEICIVTSDEEENLD